MNAISALVDKAEALLQGNPARFIAYGGAIVLWLVVAIANRFGFTRFGSDIDLPTALGLATAAIATLVTAVETIRHFVYSPATVDSKYVPVEQSASPTPVPHGSEPG